VYDRKAAGGKLAFFRRVLWCAWRGSKSDLIICGHLSLLPVACLLARLRGARLALIAHGIEAWKRRSWLYGLMSRSVDSFIAVSRYSAERFATWSKISTEQFFILPASTGIHSFLRCGTCSSPSAMAFTITS
jgi:phosphatidyl-myo-inositol dimannoside synthase